MAHRKTLVVDAWGNELKVGGQVNTSEVDPPGVIKEITPPDPDQSSKEWLPRVSVQWSDAKEGELETFQVTYDLHGDFFLCDDVYSVEEKEQHETDSLPKSDT